MKRNPLIKLAFWSIAVLAPLGCGGTQTAAEQRATREAAGAGGESAPGRCPREAGMEVSEYDTSGDSEPDVRRVFRRAGDPPVTRLVLTCREHDMNADGIKDVVRYYSEEGAALREESDRNFDGTIDSTLVFQDGRIVRQELDENGDGRIDVKMFFDDDGRPLRTERDMQGRSTETEWHPDRWEYFENGRLVRMGTDLDGDGQVDRWDRDQERAPLPGSESSAS